MVRAIGIGSPFGDDRVGWRVIERLRGRVAPAVDLQTLDRPGAALVNWMRDVDWLILIDALVSDHPPGSVIVLAPGQVEDRPALAGSHDLRLGETLRLAAALGYRPARVDLYGVAVGEPDLHRLRGAVARGAERLADRLAGQLAVVAGPRD